MIKKRQIGDQIDDHNKGELRFHPEACRAGILFPVRDSLGDTGSLLMAAPRKSFAGPGAKVSGPDPTARLDLRTGCVTHHSSQYEKIVPPSRIVNVGRFLLCGTV